MRLFDPRSLVSLVLAVMLAGCTNLAKTADAEAEEAHRRATSHLGDINAARNRADNVSVSEGLWIAKNSVRLAQADPLPEVFSSRATFNRRVKSISEFAERVGVISGLPTRVTPDALAAARGSGDATRQHATPGRVAIPAPSSLQLPLPAAPAAASAGPGIGTYLAYRDGSLKGLLDMAAARFGVSWKYVDGTIEFHHVDTRTFQVSAVPGESALNANVGGSSSAGTEVGGASAGGQSSGNTQSATVRSQLSVFASLEKSVGAMLSTHGTVVSSPATGTLTVTDTPAILARVEKFIERENRTLSKQVMINVTVLAVSLADEDNLGLNWDLVFGEMSRRFGVKSTFGTDPNSTSFSAGVLNTSGSKLAGSSMIISALSTQGKVRKETSASVAALNHQPVPVQVARQTAYLKSSQTTISANVGSSTSLTPGLVTSGFTMTVLPSVLDNGTVILQFSTDISTLRRLNTVNSSSGDGGGSQIQTPEIDTRNFLQRVAMKSGQTLVVSGFEQMEGGVDRQGVGTPYNFALGGGLAARSNKEVIVILVTPIAMPGA